MQAPKGDSPSAHEQFATTHPKTLALAHSFKRNCVLCEKQQTAVVLSTSILELRRSPSLWY